MAPIAKQDIRFCKTVDGVTIAYSTMGQGPPLVIPPQFVTHLEADLVERPFAEVYEALAQYFMVVRFDKHGTGLSEREISALTSDQDFVPDLEAVVDELRLQRFALYGLSAGGRLILHYYSKHPDRVSCLVFYGTNPKATDAGRKERQAVTLAVIRASWEFGSKLMAETLMPFGGTREDVDRIARFFRHAVDSDVVQRLVEFRQTRGDLTPLLAKVSVPTLVLHRRGDHVPFAGGRELASKISGARFLTLEGNNHLPATHEEAMEACYAGH
jgi:pimeloyl-ACP methyl ester carboxylesterase